MSAVAHINDYKEGKFFTDEFRGDLSWNGYENNVMLLNRGIEKGEDGPDIPHFTDVAMALGVDDVKDARGIAVFDFDNDGDSDIAVNHNPGDNGRDTEIPAVLYENRIGQQRNWLAVTLEGTTSNRDAVGAEVSLVAGKHRQFRYVRAGSAYAGQQSRRLYFGLDRTERVDELKIRWPNGTEEVFRDLEVNRFIHIIEGRGLVWKAPTNKDSIGGP